MTRRLRALAHGAGLAVCGWAACLLFGSGCGPQRADLEELLPDLEPEVAAVLVEPDGPAFAAFVATASTDRLIALRQPLLGALYGPAPIDSGARARLAGALAGIERALAESRGLATYAEESAFLSLQPDSTVRRIMAQRLDIQDVYESADLQAADKIERLRQLQDQLLAAGDAHGALGVWRQLAILEHRRNDLPAAVALQRQAYDQARRLGRLAEECRAWGQLVMARLGDGLAASQRDTLHLLIEGSRRARLAAVTSHLLTLHGYDEFRRGRSAASRAAFEEGIEVCRDFGEPAAAVPAMVLLMRLYATLECWEQVEQLLERANGLLDEAAAGEWRSVEERLRRAQLDNLAARRLAALGRADAAHAVFRQTFDIANTLPFAEVGYVGRQWFQSMMDADRLDLAGEAFAVLEPASAAGDLPLLALRVPLWRAWLDWRRGDLAGAAAHLSRFRGDGLVNAPAAVAGLEFPYLALQARVLWAHDRQAAEDTLRAGWRALQARLLAHEPGSEAYLDLNRNPHLRWAAQDLLGDDPQVGYGLELLWRNAMLRRAPSLADGATLSGAAAAAAALATDRLRQTGAVHLVYRLRSDGIVRWTADGAGIEQALLDIPPGDLRARLAAVLPRLAQDPGDLDVPMPQDLANELSDLAGLLLPDRFFRRETRPRRLYVTGEGFLTQIPFAALAVGAPGAYEPLIATTDLAAVRHGLPARVGRDNVRVLVVADPVLDPQTRRRFGLAAQLAGARDELAGIVQGLPAVAVLQGEAATRERISAVWDEAAVIYFIGHAITDPLVPFFSWLPLSADGSTTSPPGIDIKDILSHRLVGCEAVFLSGCATGAPYVDGYTTAPSLGDAFLDAGAAASVQTFWEVRDQHAKTEPDRMLISWRRGEADLIGAVSNELRRAMRGPRGVRHPFAWAAWSVQVAGLSADAD